MKLTALEPEDLDFLYAIENDPALWSVGAAHVPFSRYDLRQYILNQQHDIYVDQQLRLVIRVEKTDSTVLRTKAIGLVDLFDFSSENMRAELGIAILPEVQGRGYSIEALKLMIVYCREHLHLHQVYCIVPLCNEPSLAMLKKVGFTDEVILPQWIRTSNGWQDCRMLFYTF